MTTQLKFLTLKCPNCAAPLNVSNDMERFACGYCGTEQVVERRGGTVSLKALGDAIAQVQIGTDRTAAELAIRRLRDDLAAFDAQATKEDQEHTKAHSGIDLFLWIACGIGGVTYAREWGWQGWGASAFLLLLWVIIGGTSGKNYQKTIAERNVKRSKILQALAEQEMKIGLV